MRDKKNILSRILQILFISFKIEMHANPRRRPDWI